MAGKRRPRKKERKPFPILQLPREMRDKIYHFAIDIEAGGFAPLLRLNRQTHEEAQAHLLRHHSFVLIKLALPQLNKCGDFIEGVTRDLHEDSLKRNIVDGVFRKRGNITMLSSSTGGSLINFKHYNLYITVSNTTAGRPTHAAYIMLYHPNLQQFCAAFAIYDAVWPGGPAPSKLRMEIKIGQGEMVDERRLLQPLLDNWWSFRDVKVTGG